MLTREFDVVVVGAGPAGLAAARRAADCGAKVALVDDNPRAGGQIWRASTDGPHPESEAWLGGAERILGARVVAVPGPGLLAFEQGTASGLLGYRKLILATGARERFLPFPGWTLPGVVGAGGLQALVKSGFPVEGKSIVVAGSGPLLMAVAKYLSDHGARIRLIAEQTDAMSLARFAMTLAGQVSKLAQAIQLRAGLFGVPYLTGCWPVAAQGNERVDGVRLHRQGQEWTEPCDLLACGFGLIPNLELPMLLGCRLSVDGVSVDDLQQTSMEGVYAAGETTGIAGLDAALVEGEIAGFAAGGQIEQARGKFAARAATRRFGQSLERAFALRSELKRLVKDETYVCRCEDIPYSRVKNCSGFRDAKLQTRCGMGACQGRVCGGALEFLMGWKNESVRPPLQPSRISSLLETHPDRQP